MYIVLEYMAYLIGVLLLAGLLFGTTVLLMLTESGAERLTRAARYVAAQARLLAGEKLSPSKLFRHKLPENPT